LTLIDEKRERAASAFNPSAARADAPRRRPMIRSTLRHRLFSTCACCAEPFVATGISRRQLIAGGAAAVALGGLAGFAPKVFAQARPHRIDVHHHISPPTWLEALKKINRTNPPMANWSVQKTIEDMDKGGVATAITSPTTPQLKPLERDEAVRVARESNEFAKKLEADHPGRFGTFAMLPLPHIDESLKEIAFAFDTLKVDGIGMMTSYGDKWLGYNDFTPIWEELNRRKATVYTHPTDANCCVNLVQNIASSAVEYGTDTTRTIASLIFTGTSQKYPDINWIFSHGGGSLTAFAERFLVQMVSVPPHKDKFTRAIVEGELKRFHYDTAQVSNPITMAALVKLVPISQIVYGTDFPYRTAADHTRGLEAIFSGADLSAIDRENALRLLPRLRTT
jgi:6-methylsalicylate decarboxylase